MSAPSRLNKLALMLALFSGAVLGDEPHTTVSSPLTYSLSKDRTRGDIHGLYEVQEAASDFLVKERAKDGVTWVALGPNLKTIVTRCAVPLTVNWVPKSAGYSNTSVSVNCRKTVLPQQEKSWSVIVPVYAERSPKKP